MELLDDLTQVVDTKILYPVHDNHNYIDPEK
jgi:hypothetical protein